MSRTCAAGVLVRSNIVKELRKHIGSQGLPSLESDVVTVCDWDR